MSIKQPRLKQILVRQCGSNKSKGMVIAGARNFPCALGRSGLTHDKREGDGATPVGRYAILKAYFRADRVQRSTFSTPLERIKTNHGWCDEPGDRNYNRLVKLPYSANHETMWRDDNLYDFCLVLDQNYSKRMRGRGSAIFFHLASNNFQPTEGCVAIKKSDMHWLLRQIGRHTILNLEQ